MPLHPPSGFWRHSRFYSLRPLLKTAAVPPGIAKYFHLPRPLVRPRRRMPWIRPPPPPEILALPTRPEPPRLQRLPPLHLPPRLRPPPPIQPVTGANTPYRLAIKLGYRGMSCNKPTKNHTHEEANHPGPCRRHCVPNRVRIRRHPQHDHDVATDLGARSHYDDHDGYPKQVGLRFGLARMRKRSSSFPHAKSRC